MQISAPIISKTLSTCPDLQYMLVPALSFLFARNHRVVPKLIRREDDSDMTNPSPPQYGEYTAR